MNTEVIELKKLKCHKANPRLIKDYKFQSLINSLLVFPEMLELRPIVVDGSMQALGGNMRTKALLSISQMNDSEIAGRLNSLDGYKGKTAEQQSNLIQYWKVWRDKPIAHIVRADSLTDDQKREFMIKDNSSFGEWDMDALANEWNLDELNEWGLELNFGADDLSAEDEEEEPLEVVEDDFDEETEDIKARCKVGDVWQLGEHRLMCGDSTSRENVKTLLNGERADMTFTDPPYGYEYKSNRKRKGGDNFDVIMNDDKILDFFPNVVENCDGFIFVCTAWKVLDKWIPLFKKYLEMTNMVIWHKGGSGMGDLYKTFSTDYEVILTSHNGKKLEGSRCGSVWKFGTDAASSYVHPTQKPVALSAHAIQMTSKEGAIVLDCFGGSGSTLIACEKLNRKARLMELDPHYCDVIIARWEKLTGKQAVKISE